MNRLMCPECQAEMKTLDVSLEAVISGTYDPITKQVLDYDTCEMDVDKSPYDFRCPHCNELVDMDALAERNPEICDHRHVHVTRYLGGSEIVKCCDCHAHVEFKPASESSIFVPVLDEAGNQVDFEKVVDGWKKEIEAGA